MIETTEVRWLHDGVIPPSVLSWFMQGGALGAVEERHDLYWLDRRVDVGVKLRARSTLEVKVRQSSAGVALWIDRTGGGGEPLRGELELWRKWSPADPLVVRGSEPSVEVHKTIVKRRFSVTGEEIADATLADPSQRAFCDVEIVAVDDGVGPVWSFAFAAQGPRRNRRTAIDPAWRTVVSVAPPTSWPATFTTSCGYPAWLQGRIRVDSPVIER